MTAKPTSKPDQARSGASSDAERTTRNLLAGRNYPGALMHGFKPYEKYKPSGIDWLGDIPEHWQVTRTKWMFKEVDERSKIGEEELLSVSHYTGVTPRSEKNVTMIMAEDYSGYKLCRKDDLVINIMWAWMGALGISPMEGIVSSSYGVYRFRNKSLYHSRYYDYLVRIEDLVAKYNRNSKGIHSSRLRMYTDDFFDIVFPIPPLSEQIAITNFLDHKTAQIGQFVAFKEKTIALLQEQKTVIINQAVTQGLNPDIPMKDSGIEWLGQIPAHWEVKKLKFLSKKIGSGITPTGGATTYQSSGIPLIRSQNVHFDRLDLQNVAFISEKTHEEMSNSRVVSGDILLNITGGSLGRCYYVTNEFAEANVNQHVCIIRPNKRVASKYLNYLLASGIGQGQIWFFQQGGGREGLNFQNLKNFYFAVPSFSEQHQIIAHIEQQTAKIDQAIAQTEKEIGLIKEYKETLISEAVTGKIKVVDNSYYSDGGGEGDYLG